MWRLILAGQRFKHPVSRWTDLPFVFVVGLAYAMFQDHTQNYVKLFRDRVLELCALSISQAFIDECVLRCLAISQYVADRAGKVSFLLPAQTHSYPR